MKQYVYCQSHLPHLFSDVLEALTKIIFNPGSRAFSSLSSVKKRSTSNPYKVSRYEYCFVTLSRRG